MLQNSTVLGEPFGYSWPITSRVANGFLNVDSWQGSLRSRGFRRQRGLLGDTYLAFEATFVFAVVLFSENAQGMTEHDQNKC